MTALAPAPVSPQGRAGVGRQAFLDAMSRAAFSVSVITTGGPAGREGVTATAVASASLDAAGASLLVSLHRDGRATRAILRNGVFCVNVLAEGHETIAERFAGRSDAPRGELFAAGEWSGLRTGSPALYGAVASFDCRLKGTAAVREHVVLFGDVEAALAGDASPLLHWDRSYRALR